MKYYANFENILYFELRVFNLIQIVLRVLDSFSLAKIALKSIKPYKPCKVFGSKRNSS